VFLFLVQGIPAYTLFIYDNRKSASLTTARELTFMEIANNQKIVQNGFV